MIRTAILMVLLMGNMVGAATPSLWKKGRKAAYEWARNYSIAINMEGRNAAWQFLSLFNDPDVKIYPDYDMDAVGDITIREYAATRLRLDNHQRPVYEINGIKILSESVRPNGNLALNMKMVQLTRRSDGQPLEFILSVNLIYDTALDYCYANGVKVLQKRVLEIVEPDIEEVDIPMYAEEKKPRMDVFLSEGHLLAIDIENPQRVDVEVGIYSIVGDKKISFEMGREIFQQQRFFLPEGIFYIAAHVGDERLTKKIVVR